MAQLRRRVVPTRSPPIDLSGVITSERMPALSGLRGLAALAVFGLHAWYLAGQPDPLAEMPVASDMLRWLFRVGWAGVDVFFTLSGFLLALPFLRAGAGAAAPTPWAFFRRRWLRIFPAYYAQLLVLLLFAALWPDWTRLLRPTPAGTELLAHGALWFYALPAVQPWVATWWTLPVEFGFYLLLPWLVTLLAPRRWLWLLVLMLASWCWRWAWLQWGGPGLVTNYRVEQLPGRLDQFLIGMLAAWVWTGNAGMREWLRVRGREVFLVALAVFLALPALWLLVHPQAHDAPSSHPLLLPWHGLASFVIAAMVLAACEARSIWVAWLGAPPLQALGAVSYGLYLWHFPVLIALRALMRQGDRWQPEFWPFLSQSLLLSLALATVSYWLIERPCLRLGKTGKMQRKSAG